MLYLIIPIDESNEMLCFVMNSSSKTMMVIRQTVGNKVFRSCDALLL